MVIVDRPRLDCTKHMAGVRESVAPAAHDLCRGRTAGLAGVRGPGIFETG